MRRSLLGLQGVADNRLRFAAADGGILWMPLAARHSALGIGINRDGLT
jgi:hypothetical protein